MIRVTATLARATPAANSRGCRFVNHRFIQRPGYTSALKHRAAQAIQQDTRRSLLARQNAAQEVRWKWKQKRPGLPGRFFARNRVWLTGGRIPDCPAVR